MSSPVLQAIDLHKKFIQGDLDVTVLNGVRLDVANGESIAIIGASGSGKSTLLHLLGGLDVPTSGEVSINGQPLSKLPESERGRLRNDAIGFVYQFHHLLPEFTALENVAMPGLIAKEQPGISLAKAQACLDKVGMSHRLHHKPGELSGGERQRVAIARALLRKPKLLLADEPTGNLDEKTANQVFDLMLELNREIDTSLILVTHNQQLAERMQRSYQLHEGSLQAV